MTTAVSNAAADTLDRLDHVLSTTEAQPVADAEWMPGDPLWEYPTEYDQQVPRPMFEVIDDRPPGGGRCETCQVSWAGPDPCWMCGQEAPTVAERLTANCRSVTIPITVDVGPFRRAMEQVREALTSMSPALEDFINAHKEPEPVDLRQRALDARRNRGTGPAARRLDGRRR